MKAILLAAGLGTRLRPLTDSIPKCLVDINGKPLLDYWLEKFDKLGITDILINTHYMPEAVRSHIEQSPFRDIIQIAHEDILLGTGGTLIKNRAFWQDSATLVAHADNFTTSSLDGMLQQHYQSTEIDATLLTFHTNTPKSCGIVEHDESGIITAFHEKVDNPPSNLASGALAIFNPSVYNTYFRTYQSPASEVDLSRDILPNMLGRMKIWNVSQPYIDIGTIDNYQLANQIAKQ